MQQFNMEIIGQVNQTVNIWVSWHMISSVCVCVCVSY